MWHFRKFEKIAGFQKFRTFRLSFPSDSLEKYLSIWRVWRFMGFGVLLLIPYLIFSNLNIENETTYKSVLIHLFNADTFSPEEKF